jgi:flagellar biosynthetic protein FliP
MEALPWYVSGFFSILLFSAFVKILTTLSILRYGIGLQGSGIGLVIVAVSLALTLVVMPEDLQRLNGTRALLTGEHSSASPAELEARYLPILEQHADPKIVLHLNDAAKRIAAKQGNGALADAGIKTAPNFSVLTAAFLLSELREAFLIGLLIVIPFLVIDLLVVNVLMALGIQQLPSTVASFPLKLLIFVILDGWTLIVDKLLAGYM